MPSHPLRRSAGSLAVCAGALALIGSAVAASAQGAPFTIRRPPDGASVREKVRVEIPRDSIPTGGFVAFFLDGKFDVALAPSTSQHGPFTYVWDTKGRDVSDGEHTIQAVLFVPVGDTFNDSAVTEKGSSEVKVTVANIIHRNFGPMLLRYRYHEGSDRTYSRDGRTFIVGGVSDQGTTTSDTDLANVQSHLLLQVEDVQPATALVRNKLTSLSILNGAQEVRYDPSQLSNSMYQELDGIGRVHYETGGDTGLQQFQEAGIPVNNTLELPLLPQSSVAVSDSWRTYGQRLDVPGMSPDEQPRVTLTNKFEDVEWQNGYPTARIHQTYDGPISKPVDVAGIEITSPRIKFDRDIFLAFHSGTLVKTVRTLTISGQTMAQLGQPGTNMLNRGMMGGGGAPMMGGMMGGKMGGMMPGGMMGGGMMPGGMMRPGMGGGMMPGGMMGGGMMRPGMGGGMMPGGMMGGGGMMQGGMMGQMGMRPGMGGGPPGMGGSMGGMMGQMGMRPGMGGGMGQMGMMPGGGPPMFGGNTPGNLSGQATEHPISIRAVTDTQIISGH